MNRKVRPIKSSHQIKEQQINFLLISIKNFLYFKYKKAIELKEKQFPEAKKVFQGAKNSQDSLVKENKLLKEYIADIRQRYQQYQQQQQQEHGKGIIFRGLKKDMQK